MSVLEHCRAVGYVAKVLLRYLPESTVKKLGSNPSLSAALHDVGKVSPGYQLKYFRNTLADMSHPLASMYSAFDDNHAGVSELTLSSVYGDGQRVPPVAQAAGVHHGVREEKFQLTDREYLAESAEWPRERRKLIEALESEFGELGDQPEEGLATMLLAGLTCVADWIASDEDLFGKSVCKQNADMIFMAEEAVHLCGWGQTNLRHDLSFRKVFGFSPLTMQENVIEQVTTPGVYVLEAPTGMGKTEAALYSAYQLMETGQACGFYFGLPTRLTSDRIHLRVDQFLQNICKDERSARLAHGKAWLSRFSMANGPAGSSRDVAAEAWFNPMKRALLYPFAVGTVDQALLGVLNVRHFFLRLFGLAGKVVILDEVHTYDMFTGTHLDDLVKLLRQLDCTVIILSATLTAQRRKELVKSDEVAHKQDYPLLTTDAGKSSSSSPPLSKQIGVEIRPWKDHEVAEAAVKAASQGINVLCIANTVAQAQSWYCTIKSEMPENAFPAGLLHSKFIDSHRSEKENYWMQCLGKNGERPEGSVLVATQVVEQSVDIDADFLITELAPTDMLIQRLGRLWRHPRTVRPVDNPSVVIIGGEPPQEGTADEVREALGIANTRVYYPYILCRSYDVWKEYDNCAVSLPDQVRSLLDKTYRELEEEPAAWIKLRQEQEDKDDKLQRCAKAVHAGAVGIPVGQDNEQAATRYNDRPMRDVLIVAGYDDCGAEGTVTLLSGSKVVLSAFQRDIHSAAELHQNMVSLPSYMLPKDSPPSWLSKNLNDQIVLLQCRDDGKLLAGQDDIGLAYDQDKGITRLTPNISASSFQTTELDDIFETYSDYDKEGDQYEFGDW